MKEIRFPRKCSLYVTEHNVHWIRAGQNSPQKDLPARIEYLSGDGFEVSVSQQEVRTLHHHAPECFIEALQFDEPENVQFVPSGLIVKVIDEYERERERERGSFSMSIEPLGDCA